MQENKIKDNVTYTGPEIPIFSNSKVELATFPIEPMMARLVLLPIEDKEPKEEPSKIIKLDDTRKREKEMVLMCAKVMAVGALTIPITVGDIVKVFPNQFECEVYVDKQPYLIYPERNIIVKIK